MPFAEIADMMFPLFSITQAVGPGAGALLTVTNTTRSAANLGLSISCISRIWLGKYSRRGSRKELDPYSGRYSEAESKHAREGYRNCESVQCVGHEI